MAFCARSDMGRPSIESPLAAFVQFLPWGRRRCGRDGPGTTMISRRAGGWLSLRARPFDRYLVSASR